MLVLIRDELKTDVLSIRAKLESHDHRFESLERRFDSVDARFESIDHRFDSIEARFDSVDSRFDSLRLDMRAGFDEIRAEMVRLATLVEEQNANNRIVLEGHQLLWQRQERLELGPSSAKNR